MQPRGTTSRPSPHWGWITGWGVCPQTFADAANAAWPACRHTVFAPSPEAADALAAMDCDVLAGYSLGALLLLSPPTPHSRPVLAIAPILAFDAEAGRGGKTPARNRASLAARLARDPQTAVNLYLRLIGLSDLPRHLPLPPAAELTWGLDALGSLRAAPDALSRAKIFLGAEDPLVEAAHLRSEAPHAHVLPGLTHDFRPLLPAAARLLSHA